MESTNGMGMELFDGINGMEVEPNKANVNTWVDLIDTLARL